MDKTTKGVGPKQNPSEEVSVVAKSSHQNNKASSSKHAEIEDDDSDPENFMEEFAAQTSPVEEKKKIAYGGTNNEGLYLFSDEQITALVRKAVRSHLGEELGYNFPFSKEIAEVNYPKGHKNINFTLFSGEDVKENAAVHIARFTTQCGDLGKSNLYKLKLFGSSLTGAAFGWYSRLKPASVNGWDEMEKIFREQFGKIEAEVGISELSSMYQQPNETALAFLQRFKLQQARANFSLPEKEAVNLAAKGLSYKIRKKCFGNRYDSIGDLIREATGYERLLKE
ncbi:hypothetical protein M0R45_008020 [Rubus argutus]|uniref:Retrotransposon gag domain-containing protein n=1 Tax=Rubus argutus TaxID=59490 RepID=A0AAW1Y052_RUBAR